MSDESKKTPDGRPKGRPAKKPAKSVKSRASNHHPDEEPAFNTVLESEDRKKDAKKSSKSQSNTGISRASAILLALVATLAGGAIGWLGPTLLGNQNAKTEVLQTGLEQTRSELANAKSEQKKLAETLSAIQGTSRNQASSNQSIVESISALENQVQQMQDSQLAAPSEALAALEDRVSKLATLSVPVVGEDGEEGTVSVDVLGLAERLDTLETGGSGDLLARLDALETQVGEINSKPVSFPEPDTTPIELPPAETAQSAEETLNVLIETFPRAKMLEAVAAQKALAAKKPSWLQRALSRHVKTHDEEIADPVLTIDAAQAALKRGEVNQALKLMGDLNPPVRVAAADWMEVAKKAAKLVEKDL